jgi:hypothetical protein
LEDAPSPETLDPSLPPEKPRGPDGRRQSRVEARDGSIQHRDGERWPNGGRNVRSVWEIATQPTKDAHFATFPEELVRRCLLAGCPEFVCRTCGKPRERIVERGESMWETRKAEGEPMRAGDVDGGRTSANTKMGGPRHNAWKAEHPDRFIGWSDCGHAKRYREDNREGSYRPGVVLDPFVGSGTTALVARKHGRACVGIDLNAEYLELAARRTAQLSLLAEEAL